MNEEKSTVPAEDPPKLVVSLLEELEKINASLVKLKQFINILSNPLGK